MFAPRAQPYSAILTHRPLAVFSAVLIVNAALAMLLLYLERFQGIDHWNLVRDTNAIAGQPAYFGAYSNLGVLVWASTAAISIFAWLLLKGRGSDDGRLRVLGLGGLFAAIAGLDDLFMLHENSYVIGIPDKAVMAGYCLLALGFAASAVPVLHRTKWVLLVAALSFFAVSFFFDLSLFPGSVLAEEVGKLTGISFLAAYLVTLSSSVLRDGLQRKK